MRAITNGPKATIAEGARVPGQLKLLLGLVLCVSVCLSRLGCSIIVPQERGYAKIEVTDAASGDVIEGADLVVVIPSEVNCGALIARTVAPTDADGQTVFPYAFPEPDGPRSAGPLSIFFSAPETENRTYEITVNHAGQSETLTLDHADGASTAGEAFAIRLIDADTEPPVTELEVIVGSNPPAISVNGYLVRLEVCSVRGLQSVWNLTNSCGSIGSYVDAVQVGVELEGFGGYTSENSCHFWYDTSFISFLSQFGPFSQDAFIVKLTSGYVTVDGTQETGFVESEELVLVASYCLDQDGAAIECDKQ